MSTSGAKTLLRLQGFMLPITWNRQWGGKKSSSNFSMWPRSLTRFTEFSTQAVWKISTVATIGATQSRWQTLLSSRGSLTTFITRGRDLWEFKLLKLVMWRSTGSGTCFSIQTTLSLTAMIHSISRFHTHAMSDQICRPGFRTLTGHLRCCTLIKRWRCRSHLVTQTEMIWSSLTNGMVRISARLSTNRQAYWTIHVRKKEMELR